MKDKRRKKPLLFNPDKISTKLARVIARDFRQYSSSPLVYGELDDAREFFQRAQMRSILKKYVNQSGDTDEEKQKKAYNKFRDVNRHLADFNRSELFPEPGRTVGQTSVRLHRVLIRARSFLKRTLGHFDWDDWFDECKNSGGTTVDVSYADTSPTAKMTFPITGTARSINLFRYYLTYDLSLSTSLDLQSEAKPDLARYKVVEGARATTVLKDNTIDRMIAVEPTLNMYFQQGLMQLLYKILRDIGLDVSLLPELHKTLAKHASITGLLATVDWRSASDCNTIELVRYLLPPNWFNVIDITRSPRISVEGEWEELNMISTMGNAVTFPLETLIFYSIMYGNSLECIVPRTNTCFLEKKRVLSVFGDDCILPTNEAKGFIASMEGVGHMVNWEKSFIDPHDRFRESCGGDYLHGVDVRPFSLKAPTGVRASSELEPWLYIMLNRLIPIYRWYYGTLAYVYSQNLFRYLFSLFHRYGLDVKFVPPWFPDDAGVRFSDDIVRFREIYDFRTSPLSRDVHGSVRFSYCNFQYDKQSQQSDSLTYALWLKNPGVPDMIKVRKQRPKSTEKKDRVLKIKCIAIPAVQFEDMFFGSLPMRRKGGYVVSKGVSSHWYVPL